MPPGLAWLAAFSDSTGLALGQTIAYEVVPTVNALTYKIQLSWREPVRINLAVQVWNLFQKWAAANGTSPQGQLETRFEVNPLVHSKRVENFTVTVRLRERLGHPKDSRP
jgi:hypothetical protein